VEKTNMTFAICMECGAEKFGAFNACEACGFTPDADADRAYSLAMTDRYLNRQALGQIAADIRSGKKSEIETQFLEMLLAQVRGGPKPKGGKSSASSKPEKSPNAPAKPPTLNAKGMRSSVLFAKWAGWDGGSCLVEVARGRLINRQLQTGMHIPKPAEPEPNRIK
jgi:hypothetical protein